MFFDQISLRTIQTLSLSPSLPFYFLLVLAFVFISKTFFHHPNLSTFYYSSLSFSSLKPYPFTVLTFLFLLFLAFFFSTETIPSRHPNLSTFYVLFLAFFFISKTSPFTVLTFLLSFFQNFSTIPILTILFLLFWAFFFTTLAFHHPNLLHYFHQSYILCITMSFTFPPA